MTLGRVLILATLSVVASLYIQPGIPPQCFDEYQCIFHRYPSETGLKDEYMWDLRSLCAGAGQEYMAQKTGFNNVIKFNICGTVSKPIAPAPFEGGNQESPIPHSHGVAIQLIDYDPSNPNPTPPPGPNGNGICADLDTCDYQYNPGYLGLTNPSTPGVCTIGSLNYQQGVSPSNPRREQLCDPAIGGNINYCSPYNYWCCKVQSTPCTANAEVLSYYDSSAPTFNLWNEGDVNGGIYLSYAPAMNYAADPFPCGGNDPATGNAYTRSLYIRLDCDASVTSGLAGITFDEDPVQICQYNIRARTAAACPSLVNPTPSNSPTPSITPTASKAPIPPAAAAAPPSVAGPAVGSFFGGAIVASLVAFALVYLGYTSACPRAQGVSSSGVRLGEFSPLMAPSSGQVTMRVAASPA